MFLSCIQHFLILGAVVHKTAHGPWESKPTHVQVRSNFQEPFLFPLWVPEAELRSSALLGEYFGPLSHLTLRLRGKDFLVTDSSSAVR